MGRCLRAEWMKLSSSNSNDGRELDVQALEAVVRFQRVRSWCLQHVSRMSGHEYGPMKL